MKKGGIYESQRGKQATTVISDVKNRVNVARMTEELGEMEQRPSHMEAQRLEELEFF